ncbi:MAG: zinc-ribbon domain-containing protein, partial [Lachnospiraceae bacterium]|nr:zinc-ribbon domain-containing protein [Lachnospiraceae bacterium]
MDSKIIKCSNCGAEIKESDTKCPYCGYINEEGAEKEYMEKLYDIRSSLDEVDKEAASGYGRDYGRIFKLIAITVSVLIIAAGAVYLISRFSESRRVTSDPAKSDD